ncbi:hypothetical protein SUGI_0657890 [Cryptomeria japonica]|nr:hypothetical protein SUGI_0657890 [Cryptomeria japonica]
MWEVRQSSGGKPSANDKNRKLGLEWCSCDLSSVLANMRFSVHSVLTKEIGEMYESVDVALSRKRHQNCVYSDIISTIHRHSKVGNEFNGKEMPQVNFSASEQRSMWIARSNKLAWLKRADIHFRFCLPAALLL